MYSPLGMVEPRSQREIMLALFSLRSFRTSSWEYPHSLRCFLRLFGMNCLFLAMHIEHISGAYTLGRGKDLPIPAICVDNFEMMPPKSSSLENN
jgi:hypothetical protein